jgi:hypothetical protein
MLKKGFTLVEIILVFLFTIILTTIAFNFNVFNEENVYLKNFNYRLSSDLSLLKNFSLNRQAVNNLTACGYGLLISSSSYLGYVYATSSYWENCDYLASSSPTVYATSNPEYFIHINGEIGSDVIPSLQVKNDFKGEIKISTSSNNCSSGNIFDNYSKVAIVFYNPYGDYLFLGEDSSGNWQEFSQSDIYLCLSYKTETRYLKINKAGQLIVNIP